MLDPSKLPKVERSFYKAITTSGSSRNCVHRAPSPRGLTVDGALDAARSSWRATDDPRGLRDALSCMVADIEQQFPGGAE
jgi:hypothetical protein